MKIKVENVSESFAKGEEETKSGDFGWDPRCSVEFIRQGSTEYTDCQLLTT